MLLLVVVAVAAWLAWGDRFPAAGQGDVPAQGDGGRRPSSGLAIADFGGVKDDYGYLRTFTDVQQLGFLTKEETAAFHAAGAGAARILVNGTLPAGRLIVVVTQVRDAATAATAAGTLNRIETDGGFVWRAPLILENQAHSATRIHYHHGDLLVRMELSGPASGFGPLLDRQLAVVPADG